MRTEPLVRWLVAGALLGAAGGCATAGAGGAGPLPLTPPLRVAERGTGGEARVVAPPDTAASAGDSLGALPAVAAEEVAQEAERLFGQEGRALLAVGAAGATGG